MAAIPQRREMIRLRNGDRMKREDFHRAYSLMPENYRAELIGGIVFEPSPLGYSHGSAHADLTILLGDYLRKTPGTGMADNVTLILGQDDEVQPDLVLRVLDDYGGKSRVNRKGYLKGAPELVAEVAFSSQAIDLHLKKERYSLAGVDEYIVVCLQPLAFHWFALSSNKKLAPNRTGVIKSKVFPGLWIHAEGLLKADRDITFDCISEGLRSEEHRAFVSELERRKR